jgi:hypothetical protein
MSDRIACSVHDLHWREHLYLYISPSRDVQHEEASRGAMGTHVLLLK